MPVPEAKDDKKYGSAKQFVKLGGFFVQKRLPAALGGVTGARAWDL